MCVRSKGVSQRDESLLKYIIALLRLNSKLAAAKAAASGGHAKITKNNNIANA